MTKFLLSSATSSEAATLGLRAVTTTLNTCHVEGNRGKLTALTFTGTTPRLVDDDHDGLAADFAMNGRVRYISYC